jgi:phosphoglycolate phosphatase
MLTQINNPHINSAEFFYGTKEFTAKQTKLFGDYYDTHCISDIELYDGIKHLLEELKDDFILSVATNASSIYAIKMLEYLKIKKYFKYIIGANMVQNPKPAPDMLLKTLDKLNIKKQNAIVVGDSHKDSISSKKANLKFILVNWGFTKHQKQTAVSNIEELKKELKEKI